MPTRGAAAPRADTLILRDKFHKIGNEIIRLFYYIVECAAIEFRHELESNRLAVNFNPSDSFYAWILGLKSHDDFSSIVHLGGQSGDTPLCAVNAGGQHE